MSEFVMRMLGLKGYVAGGRAMDDRLRESGVKDISVVGRGAVVVVRDENGKNMPHYREAAKRIVKHDAQAIAAGSKDNDDD